jgi:hypothetical protein
MDRASNLAAPSRMSETVRGSNQTVHDHPVRVVGGSLVVIGGTLALPVNPSVAARTVGAGMAIIGGGGAGLWCAAGGPGC